MARKSIEELGDLQREAMEVIWKKGEATVREVRSSLKGRGKELAYTTVLTVLQKLAKSGWVRFRRDGRTHVYRPARSRAEESRRSVKRLLRGVFAGDRVALFQRLIEDESLDAAELEELRRLIEKRRKEVGDG
jgi:predicted transcriptional regulator